MQGYQGPGGVVQPRREQLAADPAPQRPQGDAVVAVEGEQLRPKLVAPTAAGQGRCQGGVLAEAGSQQLPPTTGLD